ncbi:acetyltransferase [Xanthomonas axonopodis pv. khayae]|nr:acetyltransferase [Xanthomonas axonopodis pv. khayae]
MTEASTVHVEHDPARQRFNMDTDGHRAELAYRRDGEIMTITHTQVPDAVSGRGIAAALVEDALAFARQHGLKVAPACRYADAYVRRHPRYQDLLA